MSETPYAAGSGGKCPHCGYTAVFAQSNNYIKEGPSQITTYRHDSMASQSGGHTVHVYASQCPNPKCQKPIVTAKIDDGTKTTYRLVHPPTPVRLVPSEVPKEIAKDFLESASVLPISEEASAALSRRCLQNLLNDKTFKGKDLNAQIDLVLKSLPTGIAENLDAIRQIGNFAAHPMKSQSTGEIADVEPEEANWNLDVLEQLFDFFYVQPRIAAEKRKKLDAKLHELGKPPLKKP